MSEVLDEYLDRQDRDDHMREIAELLKDRAAMFDLLREIKTWTQSWASDNDVVYMPNWYSKLCDWLLNE